jgi:integrase
MNAIIVHPNNNPLALLASGGDKDKASRLRQFVQWQASEGIQWAAPDLATYRDTMLADGKAPSTAAAHLATIRAAYGELLRDNDVRTALFNSTPEHLSPADRFAMVNEAITRISNATHAAAAPVRVVKHQDRADGAHLRLTSGQAITLLNAPGVASLRGLRDTALMALMLCTGVREAELCGLDAGDLRQEYGGELALHVRDGKGAKARLIPYGELDWCLVIVDHWLRAAGITSGAVFRGFYKGEKRTRPDALTMRAVQYILAEYPISIGGDLRTVKPHDLRRTYASQQYEAGLDLTAIQQNLGHSDQKTTLGYIGALDGSKRRARATISFDLGRLESQGRLLAA